ncbi:MAG: hypothetical protein HEP71_02425 [Roseivirga sp.]|nr:hypothetical protein [Roseivirga sp.]
MASFEVYSTAEELKTSIPTESEGLSMEESFIKVLDLMDFYASLDQVKPSRPDTDDINWVELKWPAKD